jgi:regulator of sigma E protease
VRPDDKIISVDGHPVQMFDDIVTTVGKITTDAGKQNQQRVDLHLVVQHKGDTGTSDIVVSALVNPPAGQGHMGVTGKVVMVSYPLWQAPGRGIVHTYEVTRDFLRQIEMMITGAAPPQVAGVVGIVNITGQVAQTIPSIGWWPILSLTAILSLNLAVVNILPFPALDGGRIVLILIEILRGGKRLKPEREGIINLIGMAILLTLMVVITISDVIHWTKM